MDKADGDLSGVDVATVVGSIAAVLAKLKELASVQQQMDKLDQFTRDMVAKGPSDVSTMKGYWNDITGKVKDMCPKVKNIFEKDGSHICKADFDKMMEEMQKAKVKMAEDVVFKGAIASVAIILVQLWRLKEVWDAIKDADNIVDQSGSKIAEIRVNMEHLKDGAEELKHKIARFEQAGITQEEKKRIMRRIRIRVPRLTATYTETRCMISELKVKLSGKVESLDVYRKEQLSNGIVNGVHFGTNLLQCVQYGNVLGAGAKALQVGITAVFAGLTVANVTMYTLAGSRLETIRKILKELTEMEVELRSVINQINNAEDFLNEHEHEED